MNFKSIEIEDKEIIKGFTFDTSYYMCSYCFTDLFMWRNHYSTEYCVEDDFLFIKMKTMEEKKTIYLCPIGKGSIIDAIEKIKADAGERNIDFMMTAVPEDIKKNIEELAPDRFDFKEESGYEDYIYTAESIKTLKGKKLHSKRNFINRFKQNYEGRWNYEELSEDNIKEMFNYQLEWCRINECEESNEFLGETCAISQALRNFKALDLKGGILKLDGEVIAFTLGSRGFHDTFIVHIEKADSSVPGAYQMINQLFAVQSSGDAEFIDREEDLGIEGLRKAKLSYYPVKMGVNYAAWER